MQRYFLSKEDYLSNVVHGEDVFHIAKVMRSKPGDLIEACYNGVGNIVKITEIGADFVNFEIVEPIPENKDSHEITLIQGLAKGDKNEEIIKHSTELGVSNVILLGMKRSIVKIEPKKEASKQERFQKIAKEAAEQSHRLSIPNVSILKSMKEIDYSAYDLKLLLDEEEAKKEIAFTLNQVSFDNSNRIAFVIGPEGGIDPQERQYWLQNGFIPVSLGKNILRTETASLAFLAMLKYEFMKED